MRCYVAAELDVFSASAGLYFDRIRLQPQTEIASDK